MLRRTSRLVFAALSTVVLVGLLPGVSHATSFPYTAKVTVPAALNPDDLHVLFTGTGGSIANVTVNPAGTTGVTGGNQIDVTWGTALVPGTVVTLTFTATFSPVAVSSGTWTSGGTTIGAVTASDVTFGETTAAPGVSTIGLMLLAALILGAGAFVLARRRAVA